MNTKKGLLLIFMLVLMGTAACAPSETCPVATMDTELLSNPESGYCLLYPTKYSIEIPGYIVINPANATADTPGDAWASIEMVPAGGQTAAQAADAQISATGPGFNVTRENVRLGGERAVVVDGLPGPDPWRKVYVVHDDRLYTLTFQPWGPSPAGGQSPLEGLYKTVMDSFHFLPLGGGQ